MKRSLETEEVESGSKRVRVDAVSDTKMIRIRPSDVPAYLRDSAFYKSLNLDDDDEFDVQANRMKTSLDITSYEDITDLLNTVRFWGLEDFPEVTVQFRKTNHVVESAHHLVEALDNSNSPKKRMYAAMASGAIEVVRCVEKFAGKSHINRKHIIAAASIGSTDCLRHALDQVKFKVLTHIIYGYLCFEGAVRNGHVDCVTLLFEYGYRFGSLRSGYNEDNLAYVAASQGHLECLRFLLEKGYGWD